MSSAWHNEFNSIVPIWFKYTISHTALQAAALTNDIQIFSLGAKEFIYDTVVKSTIAFAGTGIVTYTLSVGPTGNLVKYVAASSMTGAVTDTNFFRPAVFLVSGLENFGSTTSVRVAAVAVGANLDQSTGGSVDIYVLIGKLP